MPIWDRGFAGSLWLSLAYLHAARFVMRWPLFSLYSIEC